MERTQIVGILTAICAIAVMFIYNAEYTKKDFDLCASTDNRIRVLYKLSFEKCIYECGRRPGCQRLNYKLARKECGLFNESYSIQSNEALKCAVVTREEIDPDKKRCQCKIGMACQKNGTCQYEECQPIPPMDPTRGVIKGNMQNIGAKVKVQCNEGYTRIPDRQPVVCGNDGQWGDIPECLWNSIDKIVENEDCFDPCPRLQNTNDVSTGGTLEGDTRNYTCRDGNSQPQNITIACTLRGWVFGDISSQLCVNDDTYPNYLEHVVILRNCMILKFNVGYKTYDESREQCRRYGDLVKVDTAEKQNVLQEYMTTYRNDDGNLYWIQGQRENGEWIFSDETRINQLHWASGQPNVNADCFLITKYNEWMWADVPCSLSYGFICEYTEI